MLRTVLFSIFIQPSEIIVIPKLEGYSVNKQESIFTSRVVLEPKTLALSIAPCYLCEHVIVLCLVFSPTSY